MMLILAIFSHRNAFDHSIGPLGMHTCMYVFSDSQYFCFNSCIEPQWAAMEPA